MSGMTVTVVSGVYNTLCYPKITSKHVCVTRGSLECAHGPGTTMRTFTSEQLKHVVRPRTRPSCISQFPLLSLIRVRDIIWVWISFLFDYDVHGGCYLDTQVSSVRSSHEPKYLLGILKEKYYHFSRRHPAGY